MPSCGGCGSHVTPDYVRVLAIDPNADTVQVCPRCPDRVRRDGRPRDARGTKRFREDGNEGGEWP